MSEENNVFFAVGSWWAAVASGLWPLVAARAIQAVGGGGMVPVALAATAALYGGRARELALGAIAGAAEAASRRTLAPQSIPFASRVRCLVRWARVGVEPLSGRNRWPQGQLRHTLLP